MNAQSANGFRGRYVFISLLALLAGGSIYLFLRPGEFVFHSWLSAVGLEGLFGSNESTANQASRYIPEWILYSLPNGLWAFAYASLITLLWAESRSPARYFWYATIPVLVLGFELSQLLGFIRGIFSFADLLAGAAGMISGISVSSIIIKKRYYENATEQ